MRNPLIGYTLSFVFGGLLGFVCGIDITTKQFQEKAVDAGTGEWYYGTNRSIMKFRWITNDLVLTVKK